MTRFIALLLILLPLSLTAQEAPPRPVKLMVLGSADTALTREFYGQVAARQTVDIAFQVGGQLIEFPVIEGQTLPEGALVARLVWRRLRLREQQ